MEENKFPKKYYTWIWKQGWEVDQEIDGKMDGRLGGGKGWKEREMEKAPENGKKLLNSAHANEMNEWHTYLTRVMYKLKCHSCDKLSDKQITKN